MKKRLFTPGPTPVPGRVLARMSEQVVHHRSAGFRELAARVDQNLRYLFQTTRPVLTLTSSGTGAVESSFVSLFSPGDRIVTVNGGKFGERWVAMPRAFGLDVVELKVEWGSTVTGEALREILLAHDDVRAVYLTQCETSTGTFFDVRKLAGVVRECSDALTCVDAISGLCAHELRFDDWGVDVCVTASQKGLMVPPGLAFVALSERAEEAMGSSTLPKFYFDLRKALAAHGTHDTPWTPAVSLVMGTDAALQMIREEGMVSVWKRHARLASALRAAVGAMGLELFSSAPADSLTAVRLPAPVQWTALSAAMEERFGIVIAGGQDRLSGKIFRVAHLGHFNEQDMEDVVAALEVSLNDSGFAVASGIGVQAIRKSLENE